MQARDTAGSSSSPCPESEWQSWGSVERRLAMIKVVRALQARDPEGVFSRELDAVTLEVILA